jgi:hypothetical protein
MMKFPVYTEGKTEEVYIRDLLREFHCKDLVNVVLPLDNFPPVKTFVENRDNVLSIKENT